MARLKTHTEFIHELKGRKIAALGIYKNSRTKMWFRCDECKNKWKTTPGGVISGAGCPKCANKRKGGHTQENVILGGYNSVLIVDVSTARYPTAVMIIEMDDYERIFTNGGYGKAWAVDGGNQLYAACRKSGEQGGSKMVHTIIMDSQGIIDHKDRNGLNNLRSNLRECTKSQNAMNQKVQSNNISGTTGVYMDSQTNKWAAAIKVNGKIKFLGRFFNLKDAVIARKSAEKELFGEFAP